MDKKYYIGPTIGITQTIIGYPLDTLKTLKQNNQSITNYKIINIYKGVQYPLLINTIYNSIFFGIYDYSNKKNNNHFISGGIAGGISSIVLNPFEVYKIKSQTQHRLQFKNKYIYKGLHLTCIREIISGGVYFSSYNTLKNNNVSTFVSGGLAGCLCWLISYPVDTIKTKYQASNNKISIMNIIKTTNVWNGLSYCLVRAFIVNSISFIIYEELKDN